MTQIARVGMPLSPREHEVLATYARLGSRKETAEALGISEHTVRDRLTNAYAKLGVASAIAAFQRLGWLWVPTTDSADVRRLRVELERIRDEVVALLGRFRLTGPSARAGEAVPS